MTESLITQPRAPTRAPTRAPSRRRVLVVDDHRTFADLLRFALAAAPDLVCVGVAYDLTSGLRLVAAHRPDVVVMDVRFVDEERDGVMATEVITAQLPGTHVVLLTGHADASLMRRAARAGASALMPKDGSLSDLLEALGPTSGEGLWVHPPLLRELVAGPEDVPLVDNPLSRREREVLELLVQGLGTQEVADRLGISRNTCRGYVKSLLWKLEAHSQLEAVAVARRRGLVRMPGADRAAPR